MAPRRSNVATPDPQTSNNTKQILQPKTKQKTKKPKKRQMKSIPYQNSQPATTYPEMGFFCCSSFDTVYVCM
jgi:hypothetical protein